GLVGGDLFQLPAGFGLQHVPFGGGGPAVNDLTGGLLETMFLTPVSGLPHIRSGRLAPLAIAATQRFELMPEVPTMAEAGVPLEAAYWIGMAGPAATPAGGVAKPGEAPPAPAPAPEAPE